MVCPIYKVNNKSKTINYLMNSKNLKINNFSRLIKLLLHKILSYLKIIQLLILYFKGAKRDKLKICKAGKNQVLKKVL